MCALEKVKESAPGRKVQPVLPLPLFKAKPSLCVASALRYLDRTKTLRKSSRLFITCVNPHKLASRDTISRWVKTVMTNEELDTGMFSHHDTRAASTITRKSARSQKPLNTILRAAGWSNSSTFTKFYKMPVTNNEQFGKSVLNK